jgi:hypothetical protein
MFVRPRLALMLAPQLAGALAVIATGRPLWSVVALVATLVIALRVERDFDAMADTLRDSDLELSRRSLQTRSPGSPTARCCSTASGTRWSGASTALSACS